MCVGCHYKGDNKLVFAEDRVKVHGVPTCYEEYGNYKCLDCSEIITVWQTHVCSTLPQTIGMRNWIDNECPKCGAAPGELCWTRGFDQYGPKPKIHKRVPCVVRR